jgi:adenylate cyclase
MGLEEEATLARVHTHRREFLERKIAEHRGRIVKHTGDGILIEFSGVGDGARCAIEQQPGIAQRNARVPAEHRIKLRIGNDLGDIVTEEGHIFGDGVNIGARLEGIAQPGGICISDDAYLRLAGLAQ